MSAAASCVMIGNSGALTSGRCGLYELDCDFIQAWASTLLTVMYLVIGVALDGQGVMITWTIREGNTVLQDRGRG